MNDEPCPTCHIPLGTSLKALREERDRYIAFLTQHRSKRDEFLKWEKELKERDDQLAAAKAELDLEREKFESEEKALDELLKEVQRPEQEFEQLRQQNQSLRQAVGALTEENRLAAAKSEESRQFLDAKLTTEKKKRKEADDVVAKLRHKLSALAESMRVEVTMLKQEQTNILRENAKLLGEKKQLMRQVADSDSKLKLLSASNAKLKTGLRGLEGEISGKQTASFAISDLDLLVALSQEVSECFCPSTDIVTMGSGPFSEVDFDNYLNSLDITLYDSGCPWIIVGREGWTEKKLEKLRDMVEDADPSEVRVFSQELFIVGILTTHDPFSFPTEILLKFAEGHPALEYLINFRFEWPEIIVEEDYGEPVYLRGSYERVEESPLFRMGYQVGITHGQSRATRRSILENACQGEIPDVEDDDYMEEWGRPRQSKRLWRIAHHIAWLIRSRKSIPSMRYAVKDWQDDLNWMEEQFYTNRMRFKWPHG